MSKSKNFDSRPQELSERQVFSYVFYYCFYIIILPVATFFGSKFIIFDGFLGLNNSIRSNIFSAIVAVTVLHIILAFYIYRAYLSDTPSTKPIKKD